MTVHPLSEHDAPAPFRRYHDTRAAALYLGLSLRTLEKWRLSGEGPC